MSSTPPPAAAALLPGDLSLLLHHLDSAPPQSQAAAEEAMRHPQLCIALLRAAPLQGDEADLRAALARRLQDAGADVLRQVGDLAGEGALLKLLEEPPARALLLLVAHQPSRLLPTIRSRCRELRLAPLGAADMAQALEQVQAASGNEPALDPAQARGLAELSGGSVGEAVRILGLDGLALYGRIVALMAGLPRLDRAALQDLADSLSQRGAEARFDLTVRLVDLALSRLARAGASGSLPPEAAPNEAAMMQNLAADPGAARLWAELAMDLGARARQGRAVNLDPAALVLDMFLRMESAARQGAR